jgi:hypothetical protein
VIAIRPGQFVAGPDGLTVVQGKPYGARKPLKRPDAFIIHETVTRSAKTADSVLRKRGLSVQLVVDEGATIQHEPLLLECAHAASRNPTSYGAEVVNPYYPKHLRPGLVWTDTIVAPWAHGDVYVLPTPDQAEQVAQLIWWATSAAAGDARIPDEWPGVTDFVAMGRVPKARRGVLAHTYFGHADGAWLVLYAWLRLKAGMDPATAYSEAKRRATGVKRVDVRDLRPR